MLIALVGSCLSCKKDYSHLNTEVFGHAGISLEKRKADFYPNYIGDIQNALFLTELDGTEIDVQMTSDGELVLFHDQTLDENSNLSGCIPNHTWSELKAARFYDSPLQLSRLSDALQVLKVTSKTLILDIKHHNSCTNESIDFMKFDSVFSAQIEVLGPGDKSRLIVNSRKLELLTAISDTLVQKSLESDDHNFALSSMQANNIEILMIKLDAMTEELKTQLDNQGYRLGLYNVKTRKENDRAFQFAPDFVISDNIDYTLKCVNG